MRLETARFTLREFDGGDLADLAGYQTDPRFLAVREANADPGPAPDVLLAMFLAWKDESPRLRWQFAIEDKASSRLVGTAGLRLNGSCSREADFGIELAPDQWGRHRAAIEIAETVIGYGFEALGLEALIGRTTAGNLPVARLAAFAGAELLDAADPNRGQGAAVTWRITREAWTKDRRSFS